jgi:hypothetical protein
VLGRFGYSIATELNGNGIHRLQNVMTMGHDIHALFDSLLVCLEEKVSILLAETKEG